MSEQLPRVELGPVVCPECQKVIMPGAKVVDRGRQGWAHRRCAPDAAGSVAVQDAWNSGVPVGRVHSVSPLRIW
ncbi:hypothetical protein [Streptomyces sp. NBC_00996]|uniref:hypothetical protein n=1 Tax=Streptomyces sp. NBC_00996 TaxID=2903710 RepID=UPI00386A7E55|nr:hypothetical protein OG390_25035 [Streptomyces sp. NBC_00996]